MKRFSFFILVVLSLFYVQVSLLYASSSSLSDLSVDQQDWVTKIANANRENLERIHTFECRYQSQSNSIINSGYFAWGEIKAYHRVFIPDRDWGVVEIESDGKFWTNQISSTGPKTIKMGPLKPVDHMRVLAGAPWRKMDHDVSSQLLEYDCVRLLENATDHANVIVLELSQRPSNEHPEQHKFKKVCHYDVARNGLPIKLELYRIDEQGRATIGYSKEITKIESFGSPDQVIQIPVEYHATYYRQGEPYREDQYSVDTDSIKINQALPEELFTVTMDPGDHVIDDILGLSWTMPAAGVLGCPAPDFTLTSLAGETVTLSKLQADVVVLDFWATWCGPCQMMMPVMNSLHHWAEENDKSVVFYGITNEKADIVSSHLKEHDCDMTVLLDSEDKPAFQSYKGKSIPYIIIISKGVIQNTFIGAGGGEPAALEEHLKGMITTALGKAGP